MINRAPTSPALYTKCKSCRDRATLTNWKPTEGYDIGMRKYRCKRCRAELFLIFVNLSALLQLEKDYVGFIVPD